MKNTSLLVILLIFSVSLRAQDCLSLGCAGAYTVTTDGTQADQPSGPEWGCYNGYPRKQTIWQYFYSPSGGNYTQSFSSAADLDWLVYDMGTSFAAINCPVSPSAWTQVGCDLSYDPGGPTGPGEESAVSTIAGHYYAVALILWEPLTITFTFGTPQLGGSNLSAANCLSVLPVNIINFTAVPDAGNVLLNWTVATEFQVSHYDIQTSTDGRYFQLAATVAANNQHNYRFLHTGVTTDVVYYRLKTIDKDGKIAYSGILKIHLTTNNRLQVTNNPVAGMLNITGLKSKGDIRIIDLAGKTMMKIPVRSQALSTDVSSMRPGLYFLQYAEGNTTSLVKFLKQ